MPLEKEFKMKNKIKCEYSSCKKEGLYRQGFELINKKNASVELPFCEYHHLIVMGGHFKAKKVKKDFEIVGPLQEVEVVEQVIAAREMIKLKSDRKNLKG